MESEGVGSETNALSVEDPPSAAELKRQRQRGPRGRSRLGRKHDIGSISEFDNIDYSLTESLLVFWGEVGSINSKITLLLYLV